MNKNLLKSALIIFLTFAVIIVLLKVLYLNVILLRNIDESLFHIFTRVALLYFTIKLIQKKSIGLTFYFKHNIWYCIIALLLFYFSFITTQSKAILVNQELSYPKHFLYLARCITTGLFEEFFFRILLFHLVLDFFSKQSDPPYFKSIIITSLLFGIAHLSNLSNQNIAFAGVINQVLLAFSLGILLQMILLKTNNILAISFLHAILNYHGMKNVKLLQSQAEETTPLHTSDIIINITIYSILALLVTLYCYWYLKQRNNTLNNAS